jgi:branched-chain amino acid transport system ATP-binding protein
VLTLRDVDGRYGKIRALQGINLSLSEHKSLAVVGRNGAGKSTLLKVISGQLRTRVGSIEWRGAEISNCKPEDRAKKGIVLAPEGRGIFPGMTVEENLRVGAYWRRPGKKVRDDDMAEVLDHVPALKNRLSQRAGSLSGGEQQMLAIGRAMMAKPTLLLLDEPSLGLSPIALERLYDLLQTLVAQGVGLILVEQYVGLALSLCDDVIGLNKGRISLAGQCGDVSRSGALEKLYMGRVSDPIRT